MQSFLFGLLFQAASEIPVSTGDKSVVFFFKVVKFGYPFIKLYEHILDYETLVNHCLSDSS